MKAITTDNILRTSRLTLEAQKTAAVNHDHGHSLED